MKCFNIEVPICFFNFYFYFFNWVSTWLFVVVVNLILMYAFIVLVLFDCQADFDADNVQRRELVIFYGV